MKKILAIVLAVVMLLPVYAVNVFAAGEPASADEIVAFESAEGFSDFDPKEPNAFFGKGGVWGRKDSDMFTLSMDEIKAIISEGGSTFSFVYTGSPVGWCNGGVPVVYFHAFDYPATCKVTNTEDGKKEATLDLDEALKAWEANGKTIDDITDFTVQHGQSNFTLYSAKFTKGESGEVEDIVLLENKEFKSWDVILEGTGIDTLKTAMAKEGAIFEASYTTNGNKGWGYLLAVETNSISEGLNTDGAKHSKTFTSESLTKSLGSVNNISLFRSNYGVQKVTYNSIKVIKGDEVLVNLGERAPASWGEICTKDELTEIKTALSEEGTSLVIEYTTEGEGWGAQLIIETSGSAIGLEKDSTDKVIKMTAAEFAAACGGDIKYLARLRNNCDGNSGDTITYNYIKVTVPVSGKKRVSSNIAFIYVTDEYHAVLVAGKFLAMPHTDIGGYCPMCHAFIETEQVGDKSVFVLETTGGQDYQDAPGTFADGVALVDAENNGNARIATNWVAGGAAWNGIVKAIPTEGAWLKVTYTGKLNSIIFQTDKTSAPEAFETTAPAVVEEGEQNVAWFNCADIVANSPVALGGDFGGWANFMLNYEGDTTVYGFEVVIPEVVPVAE